MSSLRWKPTMRHPRSTRRWRPRVEALEARITPAIYTVDRVTDSGVGVGNRGDLRYCITQANQTVNIPDEIRFDIAGDGVQMIRLASQLPDITDPLFPDGYSQRGARSNSRDAGTNAVLGIVLNGGARVFSGLTITSA